MSETPNPAPETLPRPGRSPRFQLAAVALTVVSALAGTGLARWLRAPDVPEGGAQEKAAVAFPNRLFLDWKNPDLVLVVTGQQYGYLLPCGCSKPQVGGLERRYNFLQLIKAAGWPYVAVDLGDVPQPTGPAGLPNKQWLIKYLYSMRALKEMDYTAVGFGETEVKLGLSTVLDNYALNEPKPRVVMNNLIDAKDNFPLTTEPWEMVKPVKTDVTVGVTAVVGPTAAGRIKAQTRGDKKLRFENTPAALATVLADMRSKNVSLPVLLFQGPVTRNAGKKPYTEAMALAENHPEFPVIVCVSEDVDPPSRPIEVTTKAGTKSLILSVGKKGRFVGVVGVWKTGKPERPFEFRYERAEMGEEFLTPEGKEKGHPILDLMEQYAKELKDKKYLQNHGQMSHEMQAAAPLAGLARAVPVAYVGSEVCKRCHEDAYHIWKKTPHSHAYKTLVDAKRPENRQYDPECIVCHTVGFGFNTGFVDETTTPKLKDVGCESCHGPCSQHVLNKDDAHIHKLINPWKYLPADKREGATDQFCQKCHDEDNDVTWIHGGFKKKWPKVEHPTPKSADD